MDAHETPVIDPTLDETPSSAIAESTPRKSLIRRVYGNKWVRRTRRTLLLVVVCMVVFIGFVYAKYPGFVKDTVNQFRFAPAGEVIDQYTFLMYFSDYYGRMRENPETGMYDFQQAISQHDGSDFEAGVLSYHAGDYPTAVTKIEADITGSGESEDKLFWLALAYQRVAEQDNCAKFCRVGTSQHFCSLPIERTHADTAPSRRAAELFEKLLDDYDSNSTLYRWLLNFSYMTLGEFPAGVPQKYLVSGDFVDTYYGDKAVAAKARYAHINLQERAAEMGINTEDCGRGVAVEDFDGDGFLDIVVGGAFSPLRFFRNVDGKSFEDRSSAAGLDKLNQIHGVSAADYDNDGHVDLFVSRPFYHFHLLRNRGDGTFDDVTFPSGLLPGTPSKDTAFYSFVATWGDVNNDGYLDVFISQFGQSFPFMSGLMARRAKASRLYLNVPGDNDVPRKFVDSTAQFGLTPYVTDKIIVSGPFGDFDADGWPDLFVSNFMGQSVLLRNIDGKRFEKSDLIQTHRSGFMSAFLDINHDGRLDLFHAAGTSAKTSTNCAVFDKGSNRSASTVYFQTADGEFTERSEAFGGGFRIGTMGVAYGDINNDGAYEFYLGTGNPEGHFVLPNAFFMGQLDGRQPTGMMDNASMLQGFGTIQKGHSIVFFDFDNDGDQDIYQSLGGMWPGDSWPNQFFVNETAAVNTWVKIRLRGRETNHRGVGAWIRVDARTADGESIVRQVYMHNNTGFGSAPYLAHIGLKDAERIDNVTVRWPVSKTTKSYAVEIGKLSVLDENGSTRVID